MLHVLRYLRVPYASTLFGFSFLFLLEHLSTVKYYVVKIGNRKTGKQNNSEATPHSDTQQWRRFPYFLPVGFRGRDNLARHS